MLVETVYRLPADLIKLSMLFNGSALVVAYPSQLRYQRCERDKESGSGDMMGKGVDDNISNFINLALFGVEDGSDNEQECDSNASYQQRGKLCCASLRKWPGIEALFRV